MPRSFAVAPGLRAGSYPWPGLPEGVDLFLDLTEEGELEPYAHRLPAGVAHRRMPIRDFSVPTAEGMEAILDALEEALAAGWRVYLHCHGGTGRTGTVLGCLFVRRGLAPEAALAHLRGLRLAAGLHPDAPETEEQHALVRAWR